MEGVNSTQNLSTWLMVDLFFSANHIELGVIDKPRGQLRGRGLAKWQFYYITDMKGEGEGVKNTQKFDHVVYGWPQTGL